MAKKSNQKTEIDFIFLAAHQFKKPLSSMKFSLEMLLKGDFGKISKEQKDIIENILQRNNTLILIIDDLLDMAKTGEKVQVYKLTLVDIEDLIDSVISFEKKEIMDKKIEFKLEKPYVKIPGIMLDKGKMYLAVQNILDNAIKYTPVGGRINFSLSSDGKEIKIRIEDSGIGIREEDKKKLFTKFFRGSNAAKMETVGSGLGLFIAKSIIEKHNGRIWFESKENQGSKFFFTIPIK